MKRENILTEQGNLGPDKDELRCLPSLSNTFPSHWNIMRLGEVGEISGGNTPSTSVSEYWGGEISWLTPSEVTRSSGMFISQTERNITLTGLINSSTRLLPIGTVMMTSRATIGEVAINEVPMTTNQGFINIICDKSKVINQFLAYWIRCNRHAIEARAHGVTFKEILKSNFKSIPIYLPPLPEQRAIAQVLQAVQNAIQARRKEIELERERKAALMQHLFTHGTRNEPTKMSEIGEIPESWSVRRLSGVAEIAYGLTVNETRRKNTQLAPYLAVANVVRGALRLDEVKQIGMLEGDAERYRLQKGDVLLIEGNGNQALLGSAAVWNDELPFALHQNHLIRARPHQSTVLSDWLMGYLNSDSGRAQLLGKAKTSSGLHSINSQLVSSLYIPLPPLFEQHAVVEAMLACDSKITALEKEISLHEELFRALLEELMTGRLSALHR